MYASTIFPWLGGVVAAVFSLLLAVVLVGMICRRRNTPAARLHRRTSLSYNTKVARDKSATVIDADFFVANRRWSETSM